MKFLLAFLGKFKTTLILIGVSFLMGGVTGWNVCGWVDSWGEKSTLKQAHRASEKLFKDEEKAETVLEKDIGGIKENAETNDSQCFDAIDIDEFNSL